MSIVLLLLAAYAIVQGLGLLEFSLLRQIDGIAAIVVGCHAANGHSHVARPAFRT